MKKNTITDNKINQAKAAAKKFSTIANNLRYQRKLANLGADVDIIFYEDGDGNITSDMAPATIRKIIEVFETKTGCRGYFTNFFGNPNNENDPYYNPEHAYHSFTPIRHATKEQEIADKNKWLRVFKPVLTTIHNWQYSDIGLMFSCAQFEEVREYLYSLPKLFAELSTFEDLSRKQKSHLYFKLTSLHIYVCRENKKKTEEEIWEWVKN